MVLFTTLMSLIDCHTLTNPRPGFQPRSHDSRTLCKTDILAQEKKKTKGKKSEPVGQTYIVDSEEKYMYVQE